MDLERRLYSKHVVLSLHQFFLKKSHLGQNRATCSLQQLADLNPRVQVSAHTGALDEELLLRFQVRILTTKCLWLKRFYWQTQDVPYFTLNPIHWAIKAKGHIRLTCVKHPRDVSVFPGFDFSGGGPHWLLTGWAEAFWWAVPFTGHQVHCRRHQRTLWVSGQEINACNLFNKAWKGEKSEKLTVRLQSVVLWLRGGVWGPG